MSSAGSVSAMLTSLKNNAIPKRSRRLKDNIYNDGIKIEQPIRFKNKMNHQQLNAFSEKLSREKRKTTLITVVTFVATFLILIGIIYWKL